MEALIKQRSIRLAEDAGQPALSAINVSLMRLEGVESVSIDRDRVTVRYDVFKTGYTELLERIHETVYKTGEDLVSRLKATIYEFTDHNEQQHARSPFGYATAIHSVYMHYKPHAGDRI